MPLNILMAEHFSCSDCNLCLALGSRCYLWWGLSYLTFYLSRFFGNICSFIHYAMLNGPRGFENASHSAASLCAIGNPLKILQWMKYFAKFLREQIWVSGYFNHGLPRRGWHANNLIFIRRAPLIAPKKLVADKLADQRHINFFFIIIVFAFHLDAHWCST